MPLTRRQRQQLKEADAIANLTQLAYQGIEEADAEARSTLLKIAINKMVIAEIVTRYTLIDEILSIIIAHYYFKKIRARLPFADYGQTKSFRPSRTIFWMKSIFSKKWILSPRYNHCQAIFAKRSRSSTRFAMPLLIAFFQKIARSTAKTRKCFMPERTSIL